MAYADQITEQQRIMWGGNGLTARPDPVTVANILVKDTRQSGDTTGTRGWATYVIGAGGGQSQAVFP